MKQKNYEIRTITKNTADIFLVQHGSPVRSGTRYYGLYKDNTLIGAIIFNGMSSQNTAKGCFGLDSTGQTGFYEIGRFAIAPDNNTGELSTWFLAQCINRFRNEVPTKALFAYIDPETEDDAPFTENGFGCYGLTPKRSDFYEKLEEGSFKMHSRGKPQGVPGEWRPRPQKMRLLSVYDKNLHPVWRKSR